MVQDYVFLCRQGGEAGCRRAHPPARHGAKAGGEDKAENVRGQSEGDVARYLKQGARSKEALAEVRECYHVSGDYDYILRVQVEDMEAYRAFLVQKLTSIEGVGNTHSTFVIQEVKHSTAQLL